MATASTEYVPVVQIWSRKHVERVEHGVPRCRSYAPTETWTATAISCLGAACRALHCAVHILHRGQAAAVATPTQTNRNPITVEAVTVILCEPWLRSSTHACPAGYVSHSGQGAVFRLPGVAECHGALADTFWRMTLS